MKKDIESFSKNDAVYLDKKVNELDNQINFQMQKIVWKGDEFLSKQEHIDRITKEQNKIEDLKKKMGWQ